MYCALALQREYIMQCGASGFLGFHALQLYAMWCIGVLGISCFTVVDRNILLVSL